MINNLYTEILDTTNPNHYQLLRLKLFETDEETIHKASLAQMKKLKAWDLHEDEEVSSQIKQIHIQLSRTIAELEDIDKKIDYDISLAESLGLPVPSYIENIQSAPWENEKIGIKSSSNGEKFDVLTKDCPECETATLFKDVICIQCGYNFKTGEKHPKAWDDSSSELEPILDKKVSKPKVLLSNPAGFSMMVASLIKKGFLLGLVLIAVIIVWRIFHKDSRYTLTIEGTQKFSNHFRGVIEKSESWQKYFDYKAKYASKPYVTFLVFEKDEPSTLGRNIAYYSKIEIQEPQTGKVLGKGYIRYFKLNDFKKSAGSKINALGKECLRKLHDFDKRDKTKVTNKRGK